MILAVDRDAEGLTETRRALDPTRVASLVADVGSEDGSGGIVTTEVERFGRLDICFNASNSASDVTGEGIGITPR